MTTTEQVRQDIKDGIAHAHSLWMFIKDPDERGGFDLRPSPWEGPGEYQYVHYLDGRDSPNVYVKVTGHTTGESFPVSPCPAYARPAEPRLVQYVNILMEPYNIKLEHVTWEQQLVKLRLQVDGVVYNDEFGWHRDDTKGLLERLLEDACRRMLRAVREGQE